MTCCSAVLRVVDGQLDDRAEQHEHDRQQDGGDGRAEGWAGGAAARRRAVAAPGVGWVTQVDVRSSVRSEARGAGGPGLRRPPTPARTGADARASGGMGHPHPPADELSRTPVRR